jgi:predicted MFS family arabinose efflux permease
MHVTGPDHSEHGYLVSRPQARFAFVDLRFRRPADRRVDVSLSQAEWSLSDSELGALISIVSVVIALGTLPLSLLVDSWSRVKGVVVMATVWSLATIACGFAGSYRSLLVTRGFIGLGEAGYGPAAGAILSSVFPTRMRATIIGGFLAAASFGSVLGVVLGGIISARWGWKAAFGVVGFPGLVLALLYMFVRDYKAPELAVDARTTLHKARGIAVELFRARSGVAAYFAGALQLITTSTILAWLPSFFNRAYGVEPDRGGIWAAAIIICATAGIVFWSIVADRLAQRDIRWRMLTPAACCLATFAIFAIAFGALTAGPLQIGVIALGAFLMGCTTGPIPAVAIDVVHPALRSTAGSMVAIVQNLFGLGIGPLVTGALSDKFSLQTAMAIVPLSCACAAMMLVIGARSYRRDRDAMASLQLQAEIPGTALAAA